MRTPERDAVLVLTSTFPRYAGDSIPPFVLRLCQAVEKKECTSYVLAPHEKGLKSCDVIEGIHCVRFRYAPSALEKLAYGGGMLANVREAKWRWFLLPLYLASLFFYAGYFLLIKNISVVHAHWVIPQGLVAVLLKKILWWRKIRVVVTAHGGDLHANMGGLARSILVWVMRGADVVAVVSHDMKALAISLGAEEFKVIVGSMGVDVSSFSPPPAPDNRSGVLFVGRLAEKKGVAHLVRAFQCVREKIPSATLSIVGDGPLRKSLERLVDDLKLSDAVIFLGAQAPEKIPEFFQQASVCVMPSVVASTGDQEGLGLVAAEAMSCACPVIAHDLPAIRDLIEPNVTGLMTPPANEDALAAAIILLLGDKRLAEQLASNGRSYIEKNYSWASVAEKYKHMYQQPKDYSDESL